MEQNQTVLAKKVWSFVRVAYFMLRKGVSKDFNMMIKGGKIAGKALQNLMFHHHSNRAAFTTSHRSDHLAFTSPPPGEYEFSCTTSPATSNHPFSLFSLHKKHHSNDKPAEDLDMMAVNAVLKAMEIIHSEPVSPAMARQLRVTDSPFPLSGVDEDSHVDEAAEQFISLFYNNLKRQNTME